jgi:hypothetical protein
MNHLNPAFISAGRNQEYAGAGGSLGQGLSRDMSKNSLARDGSARRLVEDNQLGP